jgi:hypothetical protein
MAVAWQKMKQQRKKEDEWWKALHEILEFHVANLQLHGFYQRM